MHLRGIALTSMLAAFGLPDVAHAETTLVVVDARTASAAARPSSLELGRKVRGDAAVAVRTVTPQLPEARQQATTALDAATDALTRFRDDEALVHVAEAERALIHADLDAEVRDLLVRLNWVAARAHAALGRRARADAACRLAHALAPERRLPRAELPPAFVKQCERAARRTPPRIPFAVSIEPAAARLSLDLAPVEGTALEATTGDHYLRVESGGRVPVLLRVQVAAGAPPLSIVLPVDFAERRIGRAIAAAASGTGSWAEVSRAVTTTGPADVIVVVHAPDRVSAFDAAGTELARDASVAQARAAIHDYVRRLAGRDPSARPTSGTSALGLTAPLEPREEPAKVWYRRGWVWVGIAAAAGVAIGAYAWSNRDRTYVVDDWRLAP